MSRVHSAKTKAPVLWLADYKQIDFCSIGLDASNQYPTKNLGLSKVKEMERASWNQPSFPSVQWNRVTVETGVGLEHGLLAPGHGSRWGVSVISSNSPSQPDHIRRAIITLQE